MYTTEPRFTTKQHLKDLLAAGTAIKVYAVNNTIVRGTDPINGTIGVPGVATPRPVGVRIKDGYIIQVFD